MRLPRLHPLEAGPGQEPRTDGPSDSTPTPPGKSMGQNTLPANGAIRRALLPSYRRYTPAVRSCHAHNKRRKQADNQRGQTDKNRPGKCDLRHDTRAERRKLQIGSKRLTAEPWAHQWKRHDRRQGECDSYSARFRTWEGCIILRHLRCFSMVRGEDNMSRRDNLRAGSSALVNLPRRYPAKT